MRERRCDRCMHKINEGADYYKVSLQKHDGKQIRLIHHGDLCINCWKKIMKEE